MLRHRNILRDLEEDVLLMPMVHAHDELFDRELRRTDEGQRKCLAMPLDVHNLRVADEAEISYQAHVPVQAGAQCEQVVLTVRALH